MTTDDQAFAPLASSKNTLATYKNPFGFSLQVIESAPDITIRFNGADAAHVCATHKQDDSHVLQVLTLSSA